MKCVEDSWKPMKIPCYATRYLFNNDGEGFDLLSPIPVVRKLDLKTDWRQRCPVNHFACF
jgi:hypothetical protein